MQNNTNTTNLAVTDIARGGQIVAQALAAAKAPSLTTGWLARVANLPRRSRRTTAITMPILDSEAIANLRGGIHRG